MTVTKLPYLEHFDISANSIDAMTLSKFFEIIDQNNQLRSLNISFNTCNKGTDLHERIAKFLHNSDTLIHLDISGLSLEFSDYKHIVERGIRKSRTLLSIHMSGMGIR